MKFLALEREVPGIAEEAFGPHLRAETIRALDPFQEGTIRELYFRGDREEAVLVLERADEREVREKLASLPLVQAGPIALDLIPLVPYPGFSRLLAKD